MTITDLAGWRTSQGWTQKELAELVGVSSLTISNWERGVSKPRKDSQRRLEALSAGETVDFDLRELAPLDIWEVGGHRLEPASYVVNGPADQNDFHRQMVEMQLGGIDRSGASDLRVLSLAAKVQHGGASVPTFQAALEKPTASARAWRGTYGLHGLHRYVGRFPPHVVRALLNSFGLRPEALVLDPFLGSGTTTLEARLLGYRSHGIEINPLSVLISRVKSQFPESTQDLDDLVNRLDSFYRMRWEQFIEEQGSDFKASDVIARPENSVEPFVNYEKWFSPDALLGVSIVVEFAEQLVGFERDLVHTALSAQMRSIGNVDVDVVRAEYRKTPRVGVDALRLVQRAIRKVEHEIKLSLKSHPVASREAVVIEQGSLLDPSLGPADGTVDAIITSPPYGVESLSYLRTHLLSYRVLSKVLGMDAYDWNDGSIGSEYLGGPDVEPAALKVASESSTFRDFFDGALVGLSGADFKRTAMMMQFFQDMSEASARMAGWLAPGGHLAFVVGNKSLMGRIIPTDVIMREIFEAKGLKFDRQLTHKLKTNNSNSSVPWQERIIAEENIMLVSKP